MMFLFRMSRKVMWRKLGTENWGMGRQMEGSKREVMGSKMEVMGRKIMGRAMVMGRVMEKRGIM